MTAALLRTSEVLTTRQLAEELCLADSDVVQLYQDDADITVGAGMWRREGDGWRFYERMERRT